MDKEDGKGQDDARKRLLTARDSIRRERAEVMGRMGRELRAWRERETGEVRFKMLGVVRNFAVGHLGPAGRQHATRQLMYWALEIIQSNEPGFQQPETIERLDVEFALIRIALEGNEESQADQVRLAMAIWPYWHIRSLSAGGLSVSWRISSSIRDATSQLLTEAARCFSVERMTLAQGFCLGHLSVAQRRAGDFDASLRTALEARQLLGDAFGPGYQAEVTVGLAAEFLSARARTPRMPKSGCRYSNPRACFPTCRDQCWRR